MLAIWRTSVAGDRADRRRGRHEYRVHVRRHGFVHARDLHLEIEVGAVA